MSLPLLQDAESLAAVLDAYPAPALVVDRDVRASLLNRAARRALGIDDPAAAQRALLQRGGHLLHCIHSSETVPIFFQCRRVRNDEDDWISVEEYFKEKADIDFSHAVCSSSMEKLYPAEEQAQQ